MAVAKKYVTPIGLDFGTRNSVCAAIPEGSSVPITLMSKTGQALHCSAVHYDENGHTTGRAALDKLPNKNVVLNPKRALGLTTQKIISKQLAPCFNAEIGSTGRQKPAFHLKVKDEKVIVKTAEQVVTDILIEFKQLVQNTYGNDVAYVVTTPETWNLAQMKNYGTCLTNAGITPLKMISEPAAAHFGFKASRKEAKKQFMVHDLGGGTLDLSMMEEVEAGRYKSIALGGDKFLGSEDVDILLLRQLEKEMKEDETFKQEEFDSQKPELTEKMKEVKHKLSNVPEVTERVYGVCEKPFVYKIDQNKKKEVLKPFYDKISNCIEKMFVDKAKALEIPVSVMKDSVQDVILVGGGSRDRYLGEDLLPRILPNAQIIGKMDQPGYINPDEIVAKGAACWAASLLKVPLPRGLPTAARHMRLLSQNLGIETVGVSETTGEVTSYFHKIIDAQSVIPTSVIRRDFTTSEENQKDVKVIVYQGEGRLTTDEDVEEIGTFTVPIDTPNHIGVPKIDVEFIISKDNVLTARAGEPGKVMGEIQITDVF